MKYRLAALSAVLTLLVVNFALATPRNAVAQGTLSASEAQRVAVDAYVYGYALMTSDVTKEAFTNVTAPDVNTLQAPMNQFVSLPAYPPATYRGVTAPNADTLYSAAFLDVSKEPIVFSYPNMHGRYFLFPIYSEWTEVLKAPGARTLGSAAQHVLITGPSWHGSVPAGITQHIASPTGNLFIIGRVYAQATQADYDAVHALQKNFTLVPLSSYGKSYTPPAGSVNPNAPSVKEKVRSIIAAMSAQQYFNAMATSMAANPPVLPQDQAIVAEMAKIGLVPGKPFSMTSFPPAVQKAIDAAPKAAFDKIAAQQSQPQKTLNGWNVKGGAGGRYGADYLPRAVVSAFGWGANQPKDAVYPNTQVDSTGAPLVGGNVYRVRFAKGKLPPVKGFWSITMYDSEYFFYPNPLNKLNVSMRNHLKANADGSIDLYFSHVQPAHVAQSNWLPAPSGKFILMMRLYWPDETPPSILDATWSPPPVIKQK